jgi:uncharacterized protein
MWQNFPYSAIFSVNISISIGDIDVLIAFAPEAEWGLLEHVQMQQELKTILGREVDLISKRAIEHSANWIYRKNILSTAQPIHL